MPLKSSSMAVPQSTPIQPKVNYNQPTGGAAPTLGKKTTIRTETRNGRTIKTTTVIENGVTTVTTEEY